MGRTTFKAITILLDVSFGTFENTRTQTEKNMQLKDEPNLQLSKQISQVFHAMLAIT